MMIYLIGLGFGIFVVAFSNNFIPFLFKTKRGWRRALLVYAHCVFFLVLAYISSFVLSYYSASSYNSKIIFLCLWIFPAFIANLINVVSSSKRNRESKGG